MPVEGRSDDGGGAEPGEAADVFYGLVGRFQQFTGAVEARGGVQAIGEVPVSSQNRRTRVRRDMWARSASVSMLIGWVKFYPPRGAAGSRGRRRRRARAGEGGRAQRDRLAEKIAVPFLIVHGAGDRQIPVSYPHRSYQQAVNSPRRQLRIFRLPRAAPGTPG